MVAGLVLAALVAAAVLAGRHGRAGAVCLAACSVLWLVVNGTMEGPVLWSLSDSHGLVAADLAGLLGLALAVVLWFVPRRS